jgi:hypothetical protein
VVARDKALFFSELSYRIPYRLRVSGPYMKEKENLLTLRDISLPQPIHLMHQTNLGE